VYIWHSRVYLTQEEFRHDHLDYWVSLTEVLIDENNPNKADPDTERILLDIHIEGSHVGGHVSISD
jgi:hypothetical protein